MNHTLFVRRGLTLKEKTKSNMECICSLGLLSPRIVAVFGNQFLLEYVTKKAKNLTNY